MSENLVIPKTKNKEELYRAIIPQIVALVSSETNIVANLANISAVLKEAFGFFWVGFYLNSGQDLVLGPFQGPLACTRIAYDRGVCGHAYTRQEITIVPDVEAFPGHIACSSASKSEIVLPLYDNKDNLFGVLDVDSDQLNDFDNQDSVHLGTLLRLIKPYINAQ